MKRFQCSMLAEKVPAYSHPTNDGSATSSDESEGGISSSEASESNPEDSESEKKDVVTVLSKGNAGWADAMSKILKTNKPKKKRTVVLSRAKKLSATKTSDDKANVVTFEVDGEIKKEVIDEPQEKSARKSLAKLRKKDWESRGRIKPSYPDSEREKALSKIAIKGIVQLFNAVHKHQTGLESKLKAAGSSEIKRDRILKSVDKRAFLDVLMGNAKSEVIASPVKNENKIQLKEEEPQSSLWSVLRDDFMSDPTLKDWDKDTENETSADTPQESLSTDDDDDDMT